MSALCETPYPATYEEAIEEIKTQRNLVVRANQNWAKCAEKRELDARANRGMLKAAQNEVSDLRQEVAKLRKRLEAYGTTNAPFVE